MTLVKGTNCGFVIVAPTTLSAEFIGLIDTHAIALKDVAPAGSTHINQIGWWCHNPSPSTLSPLNAEVGIYSHDAINDRPDILLGSATITGYNSTGWKKASINVDITPGTIYWIAVQIDDTYFPTYIAADTNPAAKYDDKENQTDLPSPWGVSDDTDAYNIGIYARYITYFPTVVKGSIISENRIFGNSLNGIYLENADRNEVVSNLIDSNENYGVNLVTGDNNLLTNNTIIENTKKSKRIILTMLASLCKLTT